ncbi:MAG: hypothetical protein ACI9FW_000184 [Flavobacterium sp.]|jgi:hypothetical protein
MKKLLILLFLSQTIYAQKTYKFDYILEYKNKIDSTKLISNPTYYVNSKENSYQVLTYKTDSLNNMFEFFVKEGFKRPMVHETVNRKILLETKLITIDCIAISYNSEYPFKYKVKEYYFENLKDTIIDKIPYYHYVIKSNKPLKYQKRKNIAQSHFIVDKNSPSFLPFFKHPTIYEEWKTDMKAIPNGIIKIKYNTNWENKITDKWILEKITPIEKELIIPEDCD